MLIIPNRMRFNEKGFGSKINRNLFYPKKNVNTSSNGIQFTLKIYFFLFPWKFDY